MDVKIEKLIYGGEGLAHHEGATVFVPFVLPGEQVAVAPVEQKKKFVRARMERVIEASPGRVAAPCPHFGACGGCDYQHIPYEAQLKYKTDILRETLRRIGRIDWTGEIHAHASPPWAYRNRARWKVRPLRKGGTAAEESTSGAKAPSQNPGVMSELKLRPPKQQESEAEFASASRQETGPQLPSPNRREAGAELPSADRRESEAQLPSPNRRQAGAELPSADRREAGAELPFADRREAGAELPFADLRESEAQLPSPNRRQAGAELPSADRRESEAQLPSASREESEAELPSANWQESEARLRFRGGRDSLSIKAKRSEPSSGKETRAGMASGDGDDQGAPGVTGERERPRLAIGYYRANSTTLCAVESCEIISPLLLKTFLALRRAIAADAFPRTLREIEAFANASDSKLLLTATFAGFPSRAAELAQIFRETVPEIESLLFFDPTRERLELFGPGFVEYEACGTPFRVGHFSFFQVNRFLVDDLVCVAVESEEKGRLALDLFAGVGLFSAALAKRFDRVVAVESNPAAARDMEGNIRGGTIEVRAADVETFLERYKEKPQLVLLDPPRAGIEPGAIQRLARIAPERVTYVSCEPPTLARDLAAFREGGYDISEVHLFDLFPQTFHMEAVVRLKRRQ